MQVQRMLQCYPCFRYNGGHRVPAWHGFVQPTDRSSEYLVEIEFGEPGYPNVRVVAPPIDRSCKHLHGDGTLCLYHPDDATWSPDQCVADVIVPLTIYWLWAYELWQKTGRWYAPEAPHGLKVRERRVR